MSADDDPIALLPRVLRAAAAGDLPRRRRCAGAAQTPAACRTAGGDLRRPRRSRRFAPRWSRGSRSASQAAVEPERAPGVAPGWARLLCRGAHPGAARRQRRARRIAAPISSTCRSTPRASRPALKKQDVLLFARPGAGPAGELQLVAPDAQLPATPENESAAARDPRRAAAPDAPPAVTGVREVDVRCPATSPAKARPSCSSTPRPASRSR